MKTTLVLAFLLSGCNAAERLANGAVVEPNGEVVEPNGEIVTPAGETIEPPPGSQSGGHVTVEEIVAYESDMCLVRARHFHGLVRIPCDQIAREPAP